MRQVTLFGGIVLIALCVSAGLRALPATSGFVTASDSARIYYQILGRGEPMVVIAGGPGDTHAYFRPYFRGLEKFCRIIYFDGRGRGRSDAAGPYTLARDVEDLECLRRGLGLARWHVLGHSYGGMVAQGYALKYPDRTDKLVICDSFHSAEGWQNNIDNCNRHIRESYPEVWKRLSAMGLTGHSNTTAWRALYDPCIETLYWYNPMKKPAYQKAVDEYATESDTFAYSVYYAIIGEDPDVAVGGTLQGMDLRPLLPALKVPALVIAGRADKIATVTQATEIAALIPGSDLVVFEKSGHLPFVEEKKKFTRAVKDFIKPEVHRPK